MFVRFKRRARSRNGWPTGDRSLYAVAVEAVRVDGKPRQRVVKHLGAISEQGLPHYWHRFDFWEDVRRNLAALALPDADRTALEEQVAAVVPLPRDDERAAAEQEFADLTARL